MHSRRAAVALLCALVLPVLAACSGQPTPLCDQAAKLVDGNHLGAALSRYLDAERAGEGGCAIDGRDAVKERQSKVALVMAQAASAERRGDAESAEDLFVQALTQDVDNEQARAALARLQTAQAGTAPTPAPTVTPRSSGGSGNDPVVVILVTVVLLVALATGIIASLAGNRDRPRAAGPAAWLRGGDDVTGRLEQLEAQVAFLLESVERLAAGSPVPRVRTEYVAPRPGPQEADRTTTVSAVTVARSTRDGGPTTLLVVCRRLVHEAQRPHDDLLDDLARLGTSDAPHLEILLEEAAIAAATKGLLDPSWRVVEEAWQVEDGAHDLVARQVRELVLGRPVVLPPAATKLPDPLAGLARQVGGQVQTPGAELAGPARVLVHATGVAARPPQGASVLLTAAVRWLMYDVTADAVVRALRTALQQPTDPSADAGSAGPSRPPGGPSPAAPSRPHGPGGGSDSRPDGRSGQDETQVTNVVRLSAEDRPGYGIAHLLEHPRRPGAPPAG